MTSFPEYKTVRFCEVKIGEECCYVDPINGYLWDFRKILEFQAEAFCGGTRITHTFGPETLVEVEA